jgi:hypothetical protein
MALIHEVLNAARPCGTRMRSFSFNRC